MKLLLVSLLAAMISLSSIKAFADDDSAKDKEDVSHEPHIASQTEREHLHWGYELQPASILEFADWGVYNAGFGFYWFLSRDNLLGFSLSGGRSDAYHFYNDEAHHWHSIETGNFFVYYKHFFSNSFYITGNLSVRTGEINERYNTSGSDHPYGFRQLTMKTYGVGASIGNEWQWQKFMIGCDWVGVDFPISSKILNDTQDPGFSADQDSDEKAIRQNPQILLTRFHLGWSF